MRTTRYLSFLIGTFLLLYPAFVIADDFEDFAELDLEAMLNIEVVSASRKVQKLYEAPNAIYVITEEDIRRSGAVDLPDLFRMVPGVDVVNVFGGAYGVSTRGFNDRFANDTQVLLDGRRIASAFVGSIYWQTEEVFLEDIQHIEVIRGPASTLWGADSGNGLISIVTKDPEEDQGIMLTTKAGNKSFTETVFRYSDNLSDRLSFSITGGYKEDDGSRGTYDFRSVPKATARLKYRISDRSILHFYAIYNESRGGVAENLFMLRHK